MNMYLWNVPTARRLKQAIDSWEVTDVSQTTLEQINEALEQLPRMNIMPNEPWVLCWWECEGLCGNKCINL